MDSGRALELAIEASRFIEGQRRGAVWARTPDLESPIDHTLYHGTAGIVVFLLELAAATGDTAYEERAVHAGRELVDVVNEKSWASVSFATGWAGYAFVFHELAKRTDDPRFVAAASTCVARLLSQSSELGAGIGWIEPMPFSDITGFTGDREIYDLSVGAAGAGLALIALSHVELALRVGERLLEVGERTPEGRRWGLMSEIPFPFTAPNFAHGGAGVGYFFARLGESTGDQRFLDAAIEAASYVSSRLCSVGDGALVCHTEEQQPPEFYLGQCHGPAGTTRLFALLARLTRDDNYLDPIGEMYRGLRSIGAPQTRSWGWWNNHGRCCGDAGLGDAALLLSEAPAAPTLAYYSELANDCAEVVASQSTLTDGARWWLQAEHRARPRFVQAQTGFMQGAAGIGSFLLHVGVPASRICFPDDVI
jgi:lantibiotic modifying enzyme